MSTASPANLTRKVLRFPEDTITRIDKIAKQAGTALGCTVSRSTVARAAMTEWLDAADQSDSTESFAVIRTAIVRRGRKKRAALPPPPAE